MNSNWSYNPETLNSGQNRRFFVPCDLEIWWTALKSTSSMLRKPMCIITKPSVNSILIHSPEKLNSGQNRPFDLEIWQMTLKNNRTPLLCYFKLCASFRSYWWIQIRFTVRNTQFGSKPKIFLAVWPWNLTDDLEKQQDTSSVLL